jgi:transposase, IS5 family
MLRIRCMRQWLGCSDRPMEGAPPGTDRIRRFAGFGSVTEALPSQTALLKFRHWLGTRKLAEAPLNVYRLRRRLMTA